MPQLFVAKRAQAEPTLYVSCRTEIRKDFYADPHKSRLTFMWGEFAPPPKILRKDGDAGGGKNFFGEGIVSFAFIGWLGVRSEYLLRVCCGGGVGRVCT